MTKSFDRKVVMAHISAQQRKDQFVEAAVAVIAQHGVRGATTRRIAEAANAPLASLHYCFATKEDLFLEVFNRMGVTLLPQEHDPTAEGGSGITVGSFLRTAVEWMLANEDYALAQVDLYLWVLRTAPARAKVPYETLANTLIKQLTHAHPEHPREVVKDAVWLAISTIDGLVLQWFYQRDKKRLRRLAATHASILDDFIDDRARWTSAS